MVTIRTIVAVKIALAILWLLPSLALAQGGVVLQSGQVTPGHATAWTANGVIVDGGAALGGPRGTNITEIGVVNTGTPWCVTDVPITSPYHQLCFGANTLLGYGVLSYNAYGGAPELPFVCIINGVIINPCFGSGTGTITNISLTANPCIIATPNPITTTGTISTNIPFTVPCGGTGNTSFTSLAPLLGNGASALTQGTRSGNTTEFATSTGAKTLNDCLRWDAAGNVVASGAPCGSGSGSVTSVAQTVPVEFIITGSPITTTGTLAITKATELANTVWAGPTTGAAAVPTFRGLIAADLPSLPCASGAAGLVPATGGGTTNFLRADCTFVAPPTASPCATGAAGLVPATGGGTTNFLRADCTFAAPPSGGSVSISQGNYIANTPNPITGTGSVAVSATTCSGNNKASQANGTTNFDCVTNVANLNVDEAWTARQQVSPVSLTDGSTISVDASLRNAFTVTLTGNSHTLANPTNLQPGTYIFMIIQDATGSRTGFATGSAYKYPGGTAPTWTTTANAVDRIVCYADTTSRLTCDATLNYQ